jgi:hypothetical protein
MSEMTMSWAVLLGLGAFHGINPGMGWLFAVALGMQERRRGAVFSSLLPLALGHVLAVGVAIAIAFAVGAVLPLDWLRWLVAGILVALGVSRLFRHRHPRWASMKVSFGALTLWSFLMASAHGAGLMVVPVFLSMSMAGAHQDHHHAMAMSSLTPPTALLATLVHTIGYLVVTTFVAVVVFEKLGVGILRKTWFNLDLVWASTLLGTGLIGVLVS